MPAENDYDSDDLELLEQHDLLDSDSDISSDYTSDEGGRPRRRGKNESEDEERLSDLDETERLEQLRAPVLGLSSALGGYEEVVRSDGTVETEYQLGDDCLGCLRDLRKLWKQDDNDPFRAIARVFADVNLLHNDLVPILLKTAGKGSHNDKVALACTDLLTALTWPIDALAEIHDAVTKEKDTDSIIRLPELEIAQVQYKSSILRLHVSEPDSQRDVLSVVLRHLLLPSLSKPRIDRTDRDVAIISMCLHLFRNLLAIKDPVTTSLSSADTLANANLQSQLIVAMHKSHVLETVLMLSSSAETKEFNPWNAVALECIYHIFVGTKVKSISEILPPKQQQQQQQKQNSNHRVSSGSALASSLAAESRMKRANIMASGTTRHSRFGTTINFVSSDGRRLVARSHKALKTSVEQLTEETILKGQRKFRRRKAAQETGAPRFKAEWTGQAVLVLQDWADRFLQTGFESLSRSILQDIRAEREKMGDLDLARIRVMQLGQFFLEYFLLRRSTSEAKRQNQNINAKGKEKERPPTVSQTNEQENANPTQLSEANAEENPEDEQEEWPYSLVAEWLEPWAFKMVLVRSITAQESKLWLEFVAAVQLWTVLLRLVDLLSRSKKEEEREAADGLQAQLYYLGETLDACHTIVRSYTTQSFACLDSILSFAHIMPRMLERYSSNKDHLFIKARKQVRKARTLNELDGQENETEQIQQQFREVQSEREFKFNDFQRKLATRQLANACITYLTRYKEYTDVNEQLSKVVAIIHRIAIKAGDFRQFFAASYRASFRSILTGDALNEMDAKAPSAVNDLKKLLDYILRKFSKLTLEEQSLYDLGKRPPRPPKQPKMPAEIQVKPGKSPKEQVGIAVGLLLQKEKMQAVLWVKSGLEMASAQRAEILLQQELVQQRRNENENQVEGHEVEEVSLDSSEGLLISRNESAAEKFEPYELRYDGNDDLRLDASSLPELKLLCRVVELESNKDNALHWRWFVPKRLLPDRLDTEIEAIEQFIRQPLDTQDEELSSMVSRVRRPRASHPSTNGAFNDASNDVVDEDDSETGEDWFTKPKPKKSIEKKKRKSQPAEALTRRPRRPKQWREEGFIEDSDEEFAFAMEDEGTSHVAAIERDVEFKQDDDDDDDDESDRPDQQQDTSPTSSVTDEESHKNRKKKALQMLRAKRNSSALFFGTDGDIEEEDDENDHLERSRDSSGPSHRRDEIEIPDHTMDKQPTESLTSKRMLVRELDSDDEQDAQQQRTEENPTQVDVNKRRRLVIDDDDED